MNSNTTLFTPVPLASVERSERSRVMRDAEKVAPHLWPKCYPRIYRDYKPNEYCSPKLLAHQMLAIALKVELGYIGDSEKYEIMWASQMAQWRVPTYWVSRDLAEAIMQTVPPLEIDWMNFRVPFPAMGFLLPKGFLMHETEGEVPFVSFCRHPKGMDIPSLAAKGPRTWCSLNGGMVMVATTDAGMLTHWNMPYDAFPVANLKQLDVLVEKYDQNEHTTGWLAAPAMTKADTRLGAQVAHLIFGLWLLMERKPELVTKGYLVNKLPAKNGERPKEFWTPTVLGANYMIRRVGRDLGGTHASPRGHWVRGAWREQHYGPKSSLTKDVWVEPYWRGGEEEEV